MPGLAMDDATRGRYFDIVDRRNLQARGDHRRPARSGEARRRRQRAVDRAGGGRRPLRADRRTSRAGRCARATSSSCARCRRTSSSTPTCSDSSRRCRTSRPMRLRHTPDGGRVELRGEAAGDKVRITVRDTGPGIPPEHLPHLFDRFYKADASRTASGRGLGQRPRAVDRPRHRRAARRHRDGRQRSRRRRHLRVPPAPPTESVKRSLARRAHGFRLRAG